MNKSLLLLPFLALTLASCNQQEPEKPKVIYSETEKNSTPKEDSTQIEIADLPIHITGTDYLLHPVGKFRVYEGSKRGASHHEKGSFIISNYGEFEITGFLQNIRKQRIDSDSISNVFDKPVFIQSAMYLKNHADKNKQHLMAYTVSDKDTNQDGKLDSSDIKTLYLGSLDGSKLEKVTPDFQELIDWNLMYHLDRLYFRTIEDANKNGDFDKDDVLHYFYIDLKQNDWKPTEYQPIEK